MLKLLQYLIFLFFHRHYCYYSRWSCSHCRSTFPSQIFHHLGSRLWHAVQVRLRNITALCNFYFVSKAEREWLANGSVKFTWWGKLWVSALKISETNKSVLFAITMVFKHSWKIYCVISAALIIKKKCLFNGNWKSSSWYSNTPFH